MFSFGRGLRSPDGIKSRRRTLCPDSILRRLLMPAYWLRKEQKHLVSAGLLRCMALSVPQIQTKKGNGKFRL